jgi:beta-mannosidase
VVLFCGNNEMDEGLRNWGWQESLHYTKKDSATESEKYFKMFADRTQGLKGDIFYEDDNYISTSPKFGWGHKESLTDGDSHYWGVWWGMEPYEIYKKRVPRFASEYGMQSLPCLETIRKFAPDSSLRINSVAMRNHQKHPTGFENLDGYLKYYGFKVNGGLVKGRKVISEYGKGNPDEVDKPDRFQKPVRLENPTIKEFEDYINATQQLQADALRTAIEAHMKAQPRCMGTILWQLNEPWPGASWSLIDYYGNKKKAYYEVQKLFKEKK